MRGKPIKSNFKTGGEINSIRNVWYAFVEWAEAYDNFYVATYWC